MKWNFVKSIAPGKLTAQSNFHSAHPGSKAGEIETHTERKGCHHFHFEIIIHSQCRIESEGRPGPGS